MSKKIYVGQKMGEFRKGFEFEPITRVTMRVDDEHYYTAGDDTGREIDVENPWATQEMVDNCLKNLYGYVYKPFEAEDVIIDPSFSLGDAVTIGGIYSTIERFGIHYDGMLTFDISAPGEKELDHEYPYVSPQDRELKRRVKLGQKYNGVKIDRLNGLTITETDGETEGAKVVLNSKELTFYDMGGGKVLYFDPVSKTYKFMGELNVNDKFVVDKGGNVTLAGNIYMGDGTIIWGKNVPNKKRYAASTSGPWHDTMLDGDIYCCDWDYTAGKWGEPYKFVGTDGQDGSDANVPGYIKRTHIDATGIETFHIKANKVEAVCPAGGEGDTEIGFILTGGFADRELRYLRIYSLDAGSNPYVVFESPKGSHAHWAFPSTMFSGKYVFSNGSSIDFTGANVTGVTATLA